MFIIFEMMMFMKLHVFGKHTVMTIVDSTMIIVFNNIRRNFNKVFSGLAKNGKDTMGWCHALKP